MTAGVKVGVNIFHSFYHVKSNISGLACVSFISPFRRRKPRSPASPRRQWNQDVGECNFARHVYM